MVIDLVRVTNRTRVITLQMEWAKSLTTLNDVLKFDPRNRALATQMQDSELLQNPEPVRKFQWRRDPKFFVKGQVLSPGIVDIASIWFQAGHSVSKFFCPFWSV